MRNFALIGVLAVVGCATPQVRPLAATLVADRLAFLVDGQTTREDVLLALGLPTAQFEGERILTYLLYTDTSTREFRVLPREVVVNAADARWIKTSVDLHSLVLVFRADHVLERHSVVSGGARVP